jgi:hypothetical protein
MVLFTEKMVKENQEEHKSGSDEVVAIKSGFSDKKFSESRKW